MGERSYSLLLPQADPPEYGPTNTTARRYLCGKPQFTRHPQAQRSGSGLRHVLGSPRYQLGNLAETDYRSLRSRYLRRAALAMKSRQEREQELDEIIEEQLRRMKETAGDADE